MLTIDLTGMVALIVGGSAASARGSWTHLPEPERRPYLRTRGILSTRTSWASTLATLRAEGCQVEAAVADACQPETTNAVVEQVTKKFGRLDVLVANVVRTWSVLPRPLQRSHGSS